MEDEKYLVNSEQRSRMRAGLVLWRSPWSFLAGWRSSERKYHAAERIENERKERKNRYIGQNMDLFGNLVPFCDDVSMTLLVGSRSDDVS